MSEQPTRWGPTPPSLDALAAGPGQAAALALYRAALRCALVQGRPASHPRLWARQDAARRLAEVLGGPEAVAAVTLAVVRGDG